MVGRASPSAHEAIAVAVGSQLPALLDKPLAWTAGVTETGYSIGHSTVVAPFVCPVAVVVAVLSQVRSRSRTCHTSWPTCSTRADGTGDRRAVLRPIASPPAADHGGFRDHFVVSVFWDANRLVVGGLTLQVAVQFVLGLTAFGRWLSDGAPIAGDTWRIVRASVR